MRSVVLLACSLSLISIVSLGQIKEINTLRLSGIEKPSVDRLGNFYFSLSNGRIVKYDPNGKLLDESLTDTLSVTLLEPWNPLKVFLYSLKEKKYRFLDHHLNEVETSPFDPSFSIFPAMVCPGNEVNKYWLFDPTEMALKRVDFSTSEINLSVSLDSFKNKLKSVVFIREYQNMVFLLDRQNGIFLFNNLGKAITQIPVSGLSFFNFMGEELCYRDKNKIILFDIYTGEKRTIAELPDATHIQFTIITDERLVVGREGKVVFYTLSQ